MVASGFGLVMFNGAAVRAVVHTTTKVEEKFVRRPLRLLPLPILFILG
jgi:hypothetical protein